MTRPGRARYLLCGLSNRGLAGYALPLSGLRAVQGTADRAVQAAAELVGVVDPDRQRVAHFNEKFLAGDTYLPAFHPDEFDQQLERLRPDGVIVASPDHTHADYILATLRHGIDVIAEKPMVTTAADAARVLDAEARSAGTVRVAHNFRYPAAHRTIKRELLAGAIGRPIRVLFDYHLDIRHGASFFLRWNSRRDRSGGLSVHKSVHHLDLVTWWLGQAPTSVFAVGDRAYYGPGSPHRPRDREGNPLTGTALQRADPYHRAQLGSGTFPDLGARRHDLVGLPYHHQYPAANTSTVYDDDIDVEDIFSALISYAGGAHLSYLINFSSTWEGFRCVIAGTHGEIETVEGASITGGALPGSGEVRVRPLFGPERTVTPPVAPGGHGGADPLLRADLFLGPSQESRELGLLATSRDGATAVAVGEAIARSVRERRPTPVTRLSNGMRGRSTLWHHPLSTLPNKEEPCPTTTETNRPTTVETPSPGDS